MNQSPLTESPLVISYLTLRKTVGCLGIALPFVVFFGGRLLFDLGMQSSISGYYYTGMRDVLVGTLCSYGVFLACYKGYDRKDDIAGHIAGIFALGVAFFPTLPDNPTPHDEFIGHLHVACTSLFFLTLSYFSLYLFRKTDPTKTPTRRKLQRNAVYRVCGYIMLTAMVLIATMGLLPHSIFTAIKKFNPVFWLETIAIEAFGVSWMTKGEAILKDEAQPVAAGSPAA